MGGLPFSLSGEPGVLGSEIAGVGKHRDLAMESFAVS